MTEHRKYYSISDVAEMANVKSHVLRYWESEFPMLRPRKNRAGNRAYTERDIKIIKAINHLLYDEKYTVAGAVLKMKEDKEFIQEQLELPLEQVAAQDSRAPLETIRERLMELRKKIEML